MTAHVKSTATPGPRSDRSAVDEKSREADRDIADLGVALRCACCATDGVSRGGLDAAAQPRRALERSDFVAMAHALDVDDASRS